MTAKEYLGQAYHIDQRINSKIEQVAALRELSVNVSNILSDTPSSGTRNIRGNESVIVKIIDLENEINDDIDKLVDLKREIMESIKKVKNEDSQVILEKRYLCFKQWEQIAVDLGYSIQHTFRIHNKALKAIEKIKDESKCD